MPNSNSPDNMYPQEIRKGLDSEKRVAELLSRLEIAETVTINPKSSQPDIEGKDITIVLKPEEIQETGIPRLYVQVKSSQKATHIFKRYLEKMVQEKTNFRSLEDYLNHICLIIINGGKDQSDNEVFLSFSKQYRHIRGFQKAKNSKHK